MWRVPSRTRVSRKANMDQLEIRRSILKTMLTKPRDELSQKRSRIRKRMTKPLTTTIAMQLLWLTKTTKRKDSRLTSRSHQTSSSVRTTTPVAWTLWTKGTSKTSSTSLVSSSRTITNRTTTQVCQMVETITICLTFLDNSLRCSKTMVGAIRRVSKVSIRVGARSTQVATSNSSSIQTCWRCSSSWASSLTRGEEDTSIGILSISKTRLPAACLHRQPNYQTSSAFSRWSRIQTSCKKSVKNYKLINVRTITAEDSRCHRLDTQVMTVSK